MEQPPAEAARIKATRQPAETDNWPGKQITLYPTEVDAFGERMLAIRVKDTGVRPSPANGGGNGTKVIDNREEIDGHEPVGEDPVEVLDTGF